MKPVIKLVAMTFWSMIFAAWVTDRWFGPGLLLTFFIGMAVGQMTEQLVRGELDEAP